ncbi:MAG: AAA family ATPase [Pseudonocardia sp.]|nr:AAA family ATPase [Pseudonocardia sp.]
MPGLALQLLGRFQVRRDGEEVPPAAFGGRKVRTLLRVLAVRRPDLVPHEVLAEALWPDQQPADPAANITVLVTRARRALAVPEAVVTGPGGYALGPCTVDIAEFLVLAQQARQELRAGRPAAAGRDCTAALGLWGEPLAEDTYAEWARSPRERLLRAHVDVLETAARTALALDDPATAAGYAADATVADPLRESVAVVHAQALAAAGDRAGALAALDRLRTRLRDELGVDPSREPARLRQALLAGAPSIRDPGRGPSGAGTSARRSRITAGGPLRRGDRSDLALAPGSEVPTRAFGGLAFVGRDAELARLRAAIDAHEVVALGGVAGAGKSRLVAEATRGVALPVLACRAFLPERGEAWGLARSVLREALALDVHLADRLAPRVRAALAVLLPEVGGIDVPLDGEARRALVLAGGVGLLAAAVRDGAVLVVDDLQWADPSSLTFLASALARLHRLAAVLAFRPDEPALVPAAGRAHGALPTDTASALATVRATRAVVDVALGALPDDGLDALVGDPRLAAVLRAETDRTPFAVGEVLRELAVRGVAVAGPDGRWLPRDAGAVALACEVGREGQRRGVRRRVDRETGARAQVLALVALLARETTARTVATAAGLDPRAALDALSGLATAGLLRLGEQGWATAHDLVGETVTAALAPGDRGRLHGLLAAALEADDADPAEVARHHRDAGDGTAAAAAFERAARRALAGYATGEAAAHAEAGLALETRPGLLDARAEARAAHGDVAGALADLQAASTGVVGPARSRRLSRSAMLTMGTHDPVRAAGLAELALVEAGDDAAARAVALETAAILDVNLGRTGRAADRADAALALFRGLGDGAGVARILDGRAMAAFLDGRITEAVGLFGRIATLFEDSGDLLRAVTPRSTRGHGLVFHAEPAEGLVETSAAVQLARDLGAPDGQAYALWHRSEALSALGRHAEAEADAREALTVAGTVGHRGWTATAWRALGIALQEQQRLDEAAAAFEESARAAGETLTLFASWAAARCALVAVALGRPDEAARSVERALAVGPPLGHYEARWAQVELAAARGADGCTALAAAAWHRAGAGGHLASVPRLAELAGRS